MRILALLIPLMACDTSAPNHLGNPLSWPVQAVGTGVSNSVYNARRGKVSRFVAAHFDVIKSEVRAGSGPHLSQAMDLAQINAAKRAILRQELAADPALYLRDDTEPMVVALMVHGR